MYVSQFQKSELADRYIIEYSISRLRLSIPWII
jgi:hypothetical protein